MISESAPPLASSFQKAAVVMIRVSYKYDILVSDHGKVNRETLAIYTGCNMERITRLDVFFSISRGFEI